MSKTDREIDTGRRDVVAGILALSAGVPLSARAQQESGTHRIGYLHASTPEAATVSWLQKNFSSALKGIGYEEGRNLSVDWRYAKGKEDQFAPIAQELVESKVEAIIVVAQPKLVMAAKQATRTIPIIGLAMTTPVESGLIDSLGLPGGNLTGTAWSGPEIMEPMFDLMREAKPDARKVVALRNPDASDARQYMDAYERAAGARGMKLEYSFATKTDEVAAALEKVAASQPDILLFAINGVFGPRQKEIAAFISEQKILTFVTVAAWAQNGVGVVGYSPAIGSIVERTAYYVDQVLRGARPADLPVELPKKFDLVVNSKVATSIGYSVPASLLGRATKVIA